ncbi:MAG: hypothetical protein K6F94_07940 [Bacteroidaceae bacterium]|nr:hypothetical protein [Bacteroidaceae bacterium]
MPTALRSSIAPALAPIAPQTLPAPIEHLAPLSAASSRQPPASSKHGRKPRRESASALIVSDGFAIRCQPLFAAPSRQLIAAHRQLSLIVCHNQLRFS